MKAGPVALVFTCEHAVNAIPEEQASLFKPYLNELNSHRGIDFGAKNIALSLSQAFKAPLYMPEVSRFLVDCNRSAHHAQCWSIASNALKPIEKDHILDSFYWPFRNQVIQYIQSQIQQGHQVWHLSIHSFTPVLDGNVREAELALLYSPKRAAEKRLVYRWQRLLRQQANNWRVRLNYPYKGTDDGFTTYLRTQFSDACYLGIEIECNQALAQDTHHLETLKSLLAMTLRPLLDNHK